MTHVTDDGERSLEPWSAQRRSLWWLLRLVELAQPTENADVDQLCARVDHPSACNLSAMSDSLKSLSWERKTALLLTSMINNT